MAELTAENEQAIPSPEVQIPAGTIIEGKYRILSLIGSGASSVVYKAYNEVLSNYVAIKFIHAHLLNAAEFVERFNREAIVLASLSHQNLVKLITAGHHDRYGYFLVLEYVEGTSLAEQIKNNSCLDPARAVPYFIQMADAMKAVHEKGLLHRDLKPANVMVLSCTTSTGGEIAKVIDFGLAKFTHSDQLSSQSLTGTGAIIGSPFYMSPEQCQGRQLDVRSDIYSLGCIMYECLTGRPPFVADSTYNVMWQHINDSVDCQVLDRRVPHHLKNLVVCCLEKDPDKRPASMKEVSERLIKLDPTLDGVNYCNRTRVLSACAMFLLLGTGLALAAISINKNTERQAPLSFVKTVRVVRLLPDENNIARQYPQTKDQIRYFEVWLQKFGSALSFDRARAHWKLNELYEQTKLITKAQEHYAMARKDFQTLRANAFKDANLTTDQLQKTLRRNMSTYTQFDDQVRVAEEDLAAVNAHSRYISLRPIFLCRVAQCYFGSQYYEKAIPYYRSAAKLSITAREKFQCLYALTSAYQKSGQIAEARMVTKEIDELWNELEFSSTIDQVSQANYACLLCDLGKCEQARKLIVHPIVNRSSSMELLHAQLLLLMRLKEYAQARTMILAIKDCPPLWKVCNQELILPGLQLCDIALKLDVEQDLNPICAELLAGAFQGDTLQANQTLRIIGLLVHNYFEQGLEPEANRLGKTLMPYLSKIPVETLLAIDDEVRTICNEWTNSKDCNVSVGILNVVVQRFCSSSVPSTIGAGYNDASALINLCNAQRKTAEALNLIEKLLPDASKIETVAPNSASLFYCSAATTDTLTLDLRSAKKSIDRALAVQSKHKLSRVARSTILQTRATLFNSTNNTKAAVESLEEALKLEPLTSEIAVLVQEELFALYLADHKIDKALTVARNLSSNNHWQTHNRHSRRRVEFYKHWASLERQKGNPEEAALLEDKAKEALRKVR